MKRASAKISGFKELNDTLVALGKATGKAVLRRIGTKRMQPMAEDAQGRVRVRSGTTKDDIKVGTKLARSQRQRRGPGAAAKNSVTIHMGPGQQPQAITEEFGKFNQEPHPFMRPSFDAHADGAIDGIGEDLWSEILKVQQRRARKAERSAAKSGGS